MIGDYLQKSDDHQPSVDLALTSDNFCLFVRLQQIQTVNTNLFSGSIGQNQGYAAVDKVSSSIIESFIMGSLVVWSTIV